MGARTKMVENGIDYQFNKTKNFCGEIVETLPTLSTEHAGYECIYQNRIHHWTGTVWIRYAADTDIPSLPTPPFIAKEPADKLSPTGTMDILPLQICTIPETGDYEIEVWAYAIENSPFAASFSAAIATNPVITILGERRYFSGTNGNGATELVQLWGSGAGAVISNHDLKAFTSDHLQRIHLRAFVTLAADTTVRVEYSKNAADKSLTVKAGSKAIVRKVG